MSAPIDATAVPTNTTGVFATSAAAAQSEAKEVKKSEFSKDQVILPPSFFKFYNLDAMALEAEFAVTIGKKDDNSTWQVVRIGGVSGVSHGPCRMRNYILGRRENYIKDPVTGERKLVREDPSDPDSEVFIISYMNKMYHEQLKAVIKEYNDAALADDPEAESKGKLWKQSEIPDDQDESGGCNPQLHSEMAFMVPHDISHYETTKALYEGKGKIIALSEEDLKKWLRDNVIGIDHDFFRILAGALPKNYRDLSPEELDEVIKLKRPLHSSEDCVSCGRGKAK